MWVRVWADKGRMIWICQSISSRAISAMACITAMALPTAPLVIATNALNVRALICAIVRLQFVFIASGSVVGGVGGRNARARRTACSGSASGGIFGYASCHSAFLA